MDVGPSDVEGREGSPGVTADSDGVDDAGFVVLVVVTSRRTSRPSLVYVVVVVVLVVTCLPLKGWSPICADP